ncbi:MAG: anti-anti-sigma factor [Ignavibacteria bacterium]|nr:MAG: anti-anti-sigma factor [Ignavibacteria bacterium]KAF0159559.1 MAG: anti-anti-sigma factor [Ignavibacteria bacterium]
MSVEFNLITETKENCVVINTTGYINNIGGQKIVDEFNNRFGNGINNVILNLAHSNVVNSIGISFLIEIIEKLNQTNGKLIFTNLDPSIDKTFTIMGLFQFAKKAENIDEALKLL